MGKLFYGATDRPIEIDDRTLAHLAVVVSTKLRRSESFTLTYAHAPEDGSGRSTIWLQPAIPLRFAFDSAESFKLDPQMLQDMATDAATTRGLHLPGPATAAVDSAATSTSAPATKDTPVPIREAA